MEKKEKRLLSTLPEILFEKFIAKYGYKDKIKTFMYFDINGISIPGKFAVLSRTSKFENPTIILLDTSETGYYKIKKSEVVLLTKSLGVKENSEVESFHNEYASISSEEIGGGEISPNCIEASILLNVRLQNVGTLYINDVFTNFSRGYFTYLLAMIDELYTSKKYSWIVKFNKKKEIN